MQSVSHNKVYLHWSSDSISSCDNPNLFLTTSGMLWGMGYKTFVHVNRLKRISCQRFFVLKNLK